MQPLEVSGAVRPVYVSSGVRRICTPADSSLQLLCLSTSGHQPLNFPEEWRRTKRWQTVGRSVRPAPIGQAGK